MLLQKHCMADCSTGLFRESTAVSRYDVCIIHVLASEPGLNMFHVLSITLLPYNQCFIAWLDDNGWIFSLFCSMLDGVMVLVCASPLLSGVWAGHH